MDKKQKRAGCLPVVLAILVVVFLGNLFSNGNDPAEDSTATPSIRSVTPKATSTHKKTEDPNSAGDVACRAMKNADMAVALAGQEFAAGAVSDSTLAQLRSSLDVVNAAYKELEGDFYWYLVTQGNSMSLLYDSLVDGDQTSAFVAIDSYLDNDEYTRFCK